MPLFQLPLAILIVCLVAVSALAPAPAGAGDLALAPGETVRISIYGRDDLSGERRVEPDGRILVPLLGRMEATGLLPEALEDGIRSRLVDGGFMQAPDVWVEVLQRRDVFVAGDVQRPGAVEWRPGLTVEQAVTLAGGLRRAPVEELGTLLQAHSAVERFEALDISFGNLLAQEARLRAEIDFINLALDAETGENRPAATALDLSVFLTPDIAVLPEPERSAETAKAMKGFDLARFRALQKSGRLLELVVFPDAVNTNPGLSAIRATQQGLIEDRLATVLTNLHSMNLQIRSLREKLANLEQQLDVIAIAIGPLQEHLDAILNLRQSGLALKTDVVNLQTALANMLSSRLDLMTSIADTRIDIQQQDLAIKGFAGILRRDTMSELETVVAQVSEIGSRQSDARRSAVLAKGYLGVSESETPTAARPYEILPADATAPREAGAADPVMPGDTVRVLAPPGD